jgi:HEAT repeat protein
MEGDRAPAPLVKALGDGERDVRLTAAWALSQIGDATVTPAVADALRREPDEQVRQALVRALVESGQASAETMKGLLESKDPETRQRAVQALAGRRSPWPWPWPQPRPRPFPGDSD